MYARKWLMVASLSALSAVAMGAFAAHGLKAILNTQELTWLETASRYQMYHSLALLAVAVLLMKSMMIKWLQLSAIFFFSGILLFSGSLYALAFTAEKWLVYVTPLGGLLFLLGWLSLFFAAFKLSETSA